MRSSALILKLGQAELVEFRQRRLRNAYGQTPQKQPNQQNPETRLLDQQHIC